MAKLSFVDLRDTDKRRFTVTVPTVFYLHNLRGSLEVTVAKEGVTAWIYGLYQGKGNENFVLDTKQHHTAPNTHSHLLIKGVFADHSRFTYRGLIRLEKAAQGSAAHQANHNLVMSPGVIVDSRPDLEILANDVQCTHASTTGRINNQLRYYTETRGLSAAQATTLLADGFLMEVPTKLLATTGAIAAPLAVQLRKEFSHV